MTGTRSLNDGLCPGPWPGDAPRPRALLPASVARRPGGCPGSSLCSTLHGSGRRTSASGPCPCQTRTIHRRCTESHGHGPAAEGHRTCFRMSSRLEGRPLRSLRASRARPRATGQEYDSDGGLFIGGGGGGVRTLAAAPCSRRYDRSCL